jgi:quercetin dioxygenase-like cupin family protein/uncharacterized protein (DUF1330 family)
MTLKRTMWIAAIAALVVPRGAAHAQPTSNAAAPAYYLSEFELTDAEGIKPYSAAVESTFTPFGGRYAVRGGQRVSLEGAPAQRIVMIVFPSLAQAEAWYGSPAYRALRPIRQGSATSRVFIVDGVATAGAASQPADSATAQQITRAGTHPSVAGPAEFFTGRVRVDPVWPADGDINASGGLVTFEPGSRSAWHSHPKGQRLVVMSGVGLTQEWGKPIQEIRPGDVVWCPPGVKHWHGASPATAMTHLAVSGTADGRNVEWMERVSDEQYQAR